MNSIKQLELETLIGGGKTPEATALYWELVKEFGEAEANWAWVSAFRRNKIGIFAEEKPKYNTSATTVAPPPVGE